MIVLFHIIVVILTRDFCHALTYVDPDPEDVTFMMKFDQELYKSEGMIPCGIDEYYIPVVETGCLRSFGVPNSYRLRKDGYILTLDNGLPEAFITTESMNLMEKLIAESTNVVDYEDVKRYEYLYTEDCPPTGREIFALSRVSIPTNDNVSIDEYITRLGDEALNNAENNITNFTETTSAINPEIELKKSIFSPSPLIMDRICNIHSLTCYEGVYEGPNGKCIRVSNHTRVIHKIETDEFNFMVAQAQYNHKILDTVLGYPIENVYKGFQIMKKAPRKRRKRFLGIIDLILEIIAIAMAVVAYERIEDTMNGADAGFKTIDRFTNEFKTNMDELSLTIISQLERRESSIVGRRRLLETQNLNLNVFSEIVVYQTRTAKLNRMLPYIAELLATQSTPVSCPSNLTSNETDSGYVFKSSRWLKGPFCTVSLTRCQNITEIPMYFVGEFYHHKGNKTSKIKNPVIDEYMCGAICSTERKVVVGMKFVDFVKYNPDCAYFHDNWCATDTYQMLKTYDRPGTKPLFDETPMPGATYLSPTVLCSYCVGKSEGIPRIPKVIMDIIKSPFHAADFVINDLIVPALKLVNSAVDGILSFFMGWRWIVLLVFLIIANALPILISIYGMKAMMMLKLTS